MNEVADMDNSARAPDLSLEQEPALAALEQRVRRLEMAIVHLQDTQRLEERIVEELTRHTEGPQAAQSSSPEPPVPPADCTSPSAPRIAAPPRISAPPWLLFEVLKDVKSMFVMFFDIRFHVGWTTRLVALILVPAILTAGWWFPLAYVPVVGTPAVGILDLLLCFLLYAFLSRDVRRYRDTRGR